MESAIPYVTDNSALSSLLVTVLTLSPNHVVANVNISKDHVPCFRHSDFGLMFVASLPHLGTSSVAIWSLEAR